MKSTTRGTGAETNSDDAMEKTSPDDSSAGVTGGALAEEEDIGTEGAGTEPRESTGVEPETHPGPRKARSRKDPD